MLKSLTPELAVGICALGLHCVVGLSGVALKLAAHEPVSLVTVQQALVGGSSHE